METHLATVKPAVSQVIAPSPAAMQLPEAPPPASPQAWVRPLRGLLVLAVLWLLREAEVILLPVAIAVALMFLLAGPVHRLRRFGIPEAWGAGIVVSVLLLFVVLLGSAVAGPAAEWAERAPVTVKQLIDSIEHVRIAVLQPGSSRRPAKVAVESADPLKDKIATEGLLLTRVVLGRFFHFTLSAATTIILLYFLLASQPWLLSRTVELARKPRSRALLLSGIRQAQRDIGLFLSTMSFINLGVGIVMSVALSLIGLPNPVLWGAVVGVLNFIPYLGPALITGLLLLAGSMSFGTGTAMLAPPVAFLCCHAIEANFVSPWVMGHRLSLSPLSVFLSVMLWGWIWGLGGTLVAVPILLGFRALCRRHRAFKRVCVYLEGGRTEPPSLHALLKVREKSRAARMQSRKQTPG